MVSPDDASSPGARGRERKKDTIATTPRQTHAPNAVLKLQPEAPGTTKQGADARNIGAEAAHRLD